MRGYFAYHFLIFFSQLQLNHTVLSNLYQNYINFYDQLLDSPQTLGFEHLPRNGTLSLKKNSSDFLYVEN